MPEEQTPTFSPGDELTCKNTKCAADMRTYVAGCDPNDSECVTGCLHDKDECKVDCE